MLKKLRQLWDDAGDTLGTSGYSKDCFFLGNIGFYPTRPQYNLYRSCQTTHRSGRMCDLFSSNDFDKWKNDRISLSDSRQSAILFVKNGRIMVADKIGETTIIYEFEHEQNIDENNQGDHDVHSEDVIDEPEGYWSDECYPKARYELAIMLHGIILHMQESGASITQVQYQQIDPALRHLLDFYGFKVQI